MTPRPPPRSTLHHLRPGEAGNERPQLYKLLLTTTITTADLPANAINWLKYQGEQGASRED